MPSKHLEQDWYSQPLPDNVQFGERSWLYSSFAFAHYRCQSKCGVRVGNDTGLYHGTFFDLGPDAEIVIGNYCSFVGVIVATNGRLTIGDYTFIAHEVVIADDYWAVPTNVRAGVKSPRILSSTTTHIDIGRNVWIGAQSIIVGNVRIGEGAIIGAGSIITNDVPPYTVCAGNPMRIVRSLRRSEIPPPDRSP
jgi:acetyltransferase-like isoleucine patch superfamily enzyme